MSEAVLKLDNIDVYYDEVQALFGVSLEIRENEIVSAVLTLKSLVFVHFATSL